MPKVSRRAFARDAVVAATAAAVLPSALAQAPPPPAPVPPEVEARIQWIFTKYGSRLDEAQRADVRRILAGGQPDVEKMRAWPMPNSVEPATPFRVWRRRS